MVLGYLAVGDDPALLGDGDGQWLGLCRLGASVAAAAGCGGADLGLAAVAAAEAHVAVAAVAQECDLAESLGAGAGPDVAFGRGGGLARAVTGGEAGGADSVGPGDGVVPGR